MCHSAMAAESCAFEEGYDASFTLRHELKNVLKKGNTA